MKVVEEGVGVTGHLGGAWLYDSLWPETPKEEPSGVMGGVMYPGAAPGADPWPLCGVLYMSLVWLEELNSAGGVAGPLT